MGKATGIEERLDGLRQICGTGKGKEEVRTSLVTVLFETDAVYNQKP